MAETLKNIPPPPAGFVVDSIPEPPPGFVLDSSPSVPNAQGRAEPVAVSGEAAPGYLDTFTDALQRGLFRVLPKQLDNALNFGTRFMENLPAVDYPGQGDTAPVRGVTSPDAQPIGKFANQIPVPDADPQLQQIDGVGDLLDFRKVLNVAGEQGPAMIANVAATIANPAFGVAFIGASEAGESLENLDKIEGLGETEKLMISSGVGAFNAALEKLGIDVILGKVPGLKSRLARLVISPVSEGTTETLQGLNQIIAQNTGEGEPLFQLTEEDIQSLKQQAFGGVVLGFGGGALSAATEGGNTQQQVPKPPKGFVLDNADFVEGVESMTPEFDTDGRELTKYGAQDVTDRVQDLERQIQERDTEAARVNQSPQGAEELRKRLAKKEQISKAQAAQQEEAKTRRESPQTVRAWLKRSGIRLKTDQVKQYGFGEGTTENKNLILQIASEKGMGVDEVAEQAIAEGVIPEPPAEYNPADWFMEQVRNNSATVEADIQQKLDDEAAQMADDKTQVVESDKTIRDAETLKTRLMESFDFTEDKADAVSRVYDAVAGAWAKAKGLTKAAWYKQRIGDVKRSSRVEDDEVLFQAEQKAPVFYSKLGKVVDEKMGGAANPQQLIAMLKKAGVKDEEIEYSGLAQFVSGKNKVSKADVQAWLEENSVRVDEVVKGTVAMPKPKEIDLLDFIYGVNTTTENESAVEEELQYVDNTKYGSYQLPGGENYRELLLTLPEKTPSFFNFVLSKGLSPRQVSKNRALQQQLKAEYTAKYGEDKPDNTFKSSHFDEPNILAHVRFNEREDANGGKVLFIEEIQSDWHQAGRKRGYRGDAEKRFRAEEQRLLKKYNAENLTEVRDQAPKEELTVLDNAFSEWRDEIDLKDSVPDAPFKTTWNELAFKRMMRWAAENGFDSIAWTTGEQQAERYDLSKQIDRITYSKSKVLNAYDLSGNRVLSKALSDDSQIEDYIGKEAAKKLIENPVAEIKDSGVAGKGPSGFELKGQDLKVGGEGMKAFYDKMLVSTANKLGKKYGARVVSDTLNNQQQFSLPVTDKMRFDLMNEGLPLFQRAKGAVEFNQQGQAIIHAFKNADISTALHELAHIFRRDLDAADQQTVLDWAGAEVFTVEVEEKFARTFERYLYEGKAPNEKLKAVFEKLKTWLREIYTQITGSDIDVDITPEIRAVFDKALGVEAQQQKFAATRGGGKATFPRQTELGYRVNTDFKNSDLNNPVSINQITRQLASDLGYNLGTDLRTGSKLIKRFNKRALGLFFPDSGIVRIQSLEDINTLAHEFGHWLDFHVFGLQKHAKYKEADAAVNMAVGRKDERIRAQILNKLRQKYGNDVVDDILHRRMLRQELKQYGAKIGKYWEKLEEAIAEFVNDYVTNPVKVQRETPNFYGLFESILDEKPTIRDGLLNARKAFKQFQEQDPRVQYASSIARNTKENFLTRGIQQLKEFKNNWYYSTIDAYDYFRQLETELQKKHPNLRGENSPLLQLLSTFGIQGKVEQAILHRPFFKKDGDVQFIDNIQPLIGTKKKKGILFDILSSGKMEAFEAYLVAKRDIELHNRGLSNAATKPLATAEKTVELFERDNAEFSEKQKELVKFQNWALEYYYRSGKLSRENFLKIKEMNQFYVPFKRVFQEHEKTGEFPALRTALKDDTPQVVKRIKGSGRQVKPLLGSILKNTHDLLLAADQNATLKTLINSFDLLGGNIIQEIPASEVKPVSVIDKENPGEFKVEYQIVTDKPKEGFIVSVYDNGKVRYFDIPKEFYEPVFTKFEPTARWIRYMSKPAALLRAGAVQFDPTFALRNIFRDQPSALNYSRHGYWFDDFFKGVLSDYKADDAYQRYLASGAHQNFLTIINEQMTGQESGAIRELLLSKRQRYARNPFKVLQDINGASESATRIGAFNNAYARTGDIFLAMQEARDIGADYSRKGRLMGGLIAVVPFLNARIQHMRTLGQAWKNRETKQLARLLAVDAVNITVPALLTYFWNRLDDDRGEKLNELPAWRRYGMWNLYVPLFDGFISIPKGPVGVLFGSTPEVFLDWLKTDNPKEYKHLATQFLQEFFPFESGWDFVPQAFKPIAEHAVNKSFFSGRSIIPEGMEYLPPAEQYTEGTPEVLKLIGEATGISPRILDHYINSYTAGTGRNVLTMTDYALDAVGIVDGKFDGQKWYRAPVLRGVTTSNPIGGGSRSVQEFYDLYEEFQRVNRAKNNFVDKQDADGLDKYLRQASNEKLLSYYSQNKTAINMLRNIIRHSRNMRKEIRQDKRLGKDSKIAQIKSLDAKLTDLSQAFWTAYNSGQNFVVSRDMLVLNTNRLDFERNKRANRKSFIQGE